MTIFAKCLDDDAVGIDERKMPVAEAARLVLENREVCEQRVQNFWKHYAKIVFGNCFGAVVEYNSYDEFGSTNSKVSFARTHHGPYLCGYKQDCRMRNDRAIFKSYLCGGKGLKTCETPLWFNDLHGNVGRHIALHRPSVVVYASGLHMLHLYHHGRDVEAKNLYAWVMYEATLEQVALTCTKMVSRR